VNDEKDSQSSGSRWEPAPTPETATADAPETTPYAGWGPPEAPTAELPQPPLEPGSPAVAGFAAGSGSPAAPARKGRLRRRAALAGAGAVLVVAGGPAGFALGHGTAGTDVSETAVVQGTDPGQDGTDGDGLPGRPGFGDRGTPPDFDGDGTLPGDDGSTDGDSTDGDSTTDDSSTGDSAGDGAA
jgi:hypothetical protein